MTRSFCRSILALALGMLVTGCLTISPEQQAQRNAERCAARGYQPKTDEFNDCVLRIESERSQRMESNRRYQLEKPDNPTTANRGY
jgi:pectin methylesterase-like acyl-CoA thioesterase